MKVYIACESSYLYRKTILNDIQGILGIFDTFIGAENAISRHDKLWDSSNDFVKKFYVLELELNQTTEDYEQALAYNALPSFFPTGHPKVETKFGDNEQPGDIGCYVPIKFPNLRNKF